MEGRRCRRCTTTASDGSPDRVPRTWSHWVTGTGSCRGWFAPTSDRRPWSTQLLTVCTVDRIARGADAVDIAGHARRVGHAPPRVREYPGRLGSTSLTVPAGLAEHFVGLRIAALLVRTGKRTVIAPPGRQLRGGGRPWRPQRDVVTDLRAMADRGRAVLEPALIPPTVTHDIARNFWQRPVRHSHMTRFRSPGHPTRSSSTNDFDRRSPL